MEGREDRGMETAVSISTPPVSVLEDRLAFKPLDLTSELIFPPLEPLAPSQTNLRTDTTMGIDHLTLDLNYCHLRQSPQFVGNDH